MRYRERHAHGSPKCLARYTVTVIKKMHRFAPQYAAAGVLPVHNDQLLLGSEPVMRRGKQMVWWGAFGGRREQEDRDDPRRTAWREFNEETGGAFGNEPFPSDFDNRCLLRLYCERSRYVLYVMRSTYLHDLPCFTDADAARDETLNKRELRWVPTIELMLALHRREQSLDGLGMMAPFIYHMLRKQLATVGRVLDPNGDARARGHHHAIPPRRDHRSTTQIAHHRSPNNNNNNKRRRMATMTHSESNESNTSSSSGSGGGDSNSTHPALVQPFWPALNMSTGTIGTQQEYGARVVRDPRFLTITSHLPESEVQQVIRAAGPSEPDASIRCMLVLNRLMNRICNHCLDKTNTDRLLACSACHMTFYCSTRCQQADWRRTHSKWCCNKDAAPDEGPMATTVMKIKQ